MSYQHTELKPKRVPTWERLKPIRSDLQNHVTTVTAGRQLAHWYSKLPLCVGLRTARTCKTLHVHVVPTTYVVYAPSPTDRPSLERIVFSCLFVTKVPVIAYGWTADWTHQIPIMNHPTFNLLAAGAEIQMLGDRNVPSSNLVFSTTGTSRYDTYDISKKKSYRFIEEEHMEMLQAEGK